jgi:osmotically-inducible protein OsmY
MRSQPIRLAATLLAAVTLGSLLAACAPLLVGGAAVGTALVVTDRRTSGAQLEDEGIELRSASRIREAIGDRAHINITSYNRQVLLTGEVPNDQVRQQAEQLVSTVPNIRGIVNELAVMANTTLTQRSSDVLVTGKVRASLVDAADVQATAFRVVTERGIVYLMGRVTQREAERRREGGARVRIHHRGRTPARLGPGSCAGPRGQPLSRLQRNRLIRLDVSQRLPPCACTSA